MNTSADLELAVHIKEAMSLWRRANEKRAVRASEIASNDVPATCFLSVIAASLVNAATTRNAGVC